MSSPKAGVKEKAIKHLNSYVKRLGYSESLGEDIKNDVVTAYEAGFRQARVEDGIRIKNLEPLNILKNRYERALVEICSKDSKEEMLQIANKILTESRITQ